MAASLAKAVVSHGADVIARGNRATASPEVQAERERICRACPLLDQGRDRCKKCGCVAMGVKRSWATEACPVGHWPAV